MFHSESKFLNNFENEQALSTLFPFGPGDTAIFQLLDRREDPDNPGRLLVPFMYMVRCRQRINDPTRSDKSKSRYITVANITQEYQDEKGQLVTKSPHPIFYGNLQGIKILNGDREADVNEYQFLRMCDENASNENRDKNRTPIFEELNPEKQAAADRLDRQTRYMAIDKAKRMSESEAREFAASMAWDSTQKIDIIRNQIEDFAEQDAAEFNSRLGDVNRTLKANVKMALDENIIAYQVEGRKFIFVADKSTICAYPTRIEATQYVDRLSEFFITNKLEGKKIYELMVSRLTTKLQMVEAGELKGN